MTEPCKFEHEILTLKDELPKMETRLVEKINGNRDIVIEQFKQTKKSIDQLADTIKGVNATKPGLIHSVLRNSEKISKLWWLYAVVLLAILGLLFKVIFFPHIVIN